MKSVVVLGIPCKKYVHIYVSPIRLGKAHKKKNKKTVVAVPLRPPPLELGGSRFFSHKIVVNGFLQFLFSPKFWTKLGRTKIAQFFG